MYDLSEYACMTSQSVCVCMTSQSVSVPTAPVDGDGIVPEELEKRLEAHLSTRPREVGGNKPFWSMLYLIPTFHNPTGVCLSPGTSACTCTCTCLTQYMSNIQYTIMVNTQYISTSSSFCFI